MITFAAFPETQRNLLALLAAHPELKSHLEKEFWFKGEKIYELYEISRPPDGVSQIRHAAAIASITAHAADPLN